MVQHSTVPVKIDGEHVDVDIDVADLVRELNAADFKTLQSCQEASPKLWEAGESYIEIEHLRAAERERLLKAIERTLQRMASENYPAFSTCRVGIMDEVQGIIAVHPKYVDRTTQLVCSCFNRKGDLGAARARRREVLQELAKTLREG